MTDNSNIISAEPNLDRRPLDPKQYPLLHKIKTPADLRKLSIDELTDLCKELRHFLIHSLASNPGHFASSMGAVELTVALHYVFDTPYDRIVWDVGHQAYSHKLLTGRAELFHTNRSFGGMSGFPNPAESEYDTFSAGHASNSISAALGMSVAAQLSGDDPRRHVVAVIGDASISGGLAFEGINNAANQANNLLIILNDNDMSIDRNVGSLNSYLAHMTTSRAYNSFRFKLFKGLRRIGLIGDKGRGRIMRLNNSLKSFFTKEQNLFEGLNIRYFGPFDGHDLPRMIKVLQEIKDMNGPRLLHLRTVKGRGFKPAEENPAQWHAPGKFDPENGERKQSSSAKCPPKYQDVFGTTLVELAGENPDIVGITAAMLSGTSMSKLQKEFPERTFDVGISEGHAVTFAGGLAKDGKRPVVAIYSSFLQRAYDHIIHDVALQRLPVLFAIDRAGLVGEDGATHHGLFDLSYLSDIPSMTIASPRNEIYLRHLMHTALSLPADQAGPWAIRYPRGAGSNVDWQQPMKQLETGRGELLTPGSQIAVLSLGPIADEAAKAVAAARQKGIDTAHYDMIFLRPIDTEILDSLGRQNIPVITVEDASIKGGLGSTVVEWLNDHGYSNRVRRIGVPENKFVSQGTIAQLRKLCRMDADAILSSIVELTSPNS
ncbi:MAG: 1-deoxy-D-xylulose-5-phosphate synthase [Bacteroides sp.]|nr:1-deoxy-D-xylulose-5-phosphate synthase [Bacteroides sp.]MCM1412889.1 1-deoxy-D-xylulose-5-phosphate synthase [Bacteroides sp.]MCM1471558.1 1-deoxy-D-xylulose-5-phosphate synthase [Bacteroides sp.]